MKYKQILPVFTFLLATFPASQANACGGFFCETTPIAQAGEQIVFHQQGNDVTAMVRILYQGDAESFSWVVPVPTSPEISVGADQTFDQLDAATRPQFQLDTVGESCQFPVDLNAPTASPAPADNEADGVTVEETLSVGPFAIEIVSSTNPEALANWLSENGYEISARGAELIAPYVNDGMKFVAVKLRSGQATGSIQPLIMKYQSESPTIPIRLTAVAAQDDMGVLAWVVGDARAVPENYFHVIPNYTRLNWYTGLNNAYVSYQALITDAMNEAGGQGFATDLATRIDKDLVQALPDATSLNELLASLEGESDATFLSNLIAASASLAFQAAVSAALPLRNGEDSSVYFSPLALQANYTAEELAAARATLRTQFQDLVIKPIENSSALLPEGRYLTRLYTTLSADEMTLDPTFVYNQDMPEQPRLRKATLQASCDSNGTKWTLTLGEGTGREGEMVINASGNVPFGSAPSGVSQQASTSVVQKTSADAAPILISSNDFATLTLGNSGDVVAAPDDDDDNGFLGSVDWWWLMLASVLLLLRARRS